MDIQGLFSDAMTYRLEVEGVAPVDNSDPLPSHKPTLDGSAPTANKAGKKTDTSQRKRGLSYQGANLDKVKKPLRSDMTTAQAPMDNDGHASGGSKGLASVSPNNTLATQSPAPNMDHLSSHGSPESEDYGVCPRCKKPISQCQCRNNNKAETSDGTYGLCPHCGRTDCAVCVDCNQQVCRCRCTDTAKETPPCDDAIPDKEGDAPVCENSGSTNSTQVCDDESDEDDEFLYATNGHMWCSNEVCADCNSTFCLCSDVEAFDPTDTEARVNQSDETEPCTYCGSTTYCDCPKDTHSANVSSATDSMELTATKCMWCKRTDCPVCVECNDPWCICQCRLGPLRHSTDVTPWEKDIPEYNEHQAEFFRANAMPSTSHTMSRDDNDKATTVPEFWEWQKPNLVQYEKAKRGVARAKALMTPSQPCSSSSQHTLMHYSNDDMHGNDAANIKSVPTAMTVDDESTPDKDDDNALSQYGEFTLEIPIELFWQQVRPEQAILAWELSALQRYEKKSVNILTRWERCIKNPSLLKNEYDQRLRNDILESQLQLELYGDIYSHSRPGYIRSRIMSRVLPLLLLNYTLESALRDRGACYSIPVRIRDSESALTVQNFMSSESVQKLEGMTNKKFGQELKQGVITCTIPLNGRLAESISKVIRGDAVLRFSLSLMMLFRQAPRVDVITLSDSEDDNDNAVVQDEMIPKASPTDTKGIIPQKAASELKGTAFTPEQFLLLLLMSMIARPVQAHTSYGTHLKWVERALESIELYKHYAYQLENNSKFWELYWNEILVNCWASTLVTPHGKFVQISSNADYAPAEKLDTAKGVIIARLFKLNTLYTQVKRLCAIKITDPLINMGRCRTVQMQLHAITGVIKELRSWKNAYDALLHEPPKSVKVSWSPRETLDMAKQHAIIYNLESFLNREDANSAFESRFELREQRLSPVHTQF